MFVCKEHLELAMDDVLADESLPVITETTTEAVCQYCEAKAAYELHAQAVRVEY